MKKILLYTDTPQTGGAELQIFLLAKFLNKQNYTPILAVSDYSGLDKWCENFEKEGIKVIRLNVKSKHDPKHLPQLKSIIKQEKIDLLHAHIWNPASCRYAFFAGSQTNTPIVTTEHDPFKISWLKDLFKKNTLKKIDKIITVSENNAKIIQQLYPKHAEKIQVIHNGIDTTWWQSQLLRFSNKDLKKIKIEKFFAKEDTLIIITVAELHERKGLEYLIRSIPLIVEDFSNTKLVIVGEGPNRKNLETIVEKLKIKHLVTFMGRQKNVPKLLKSSNIFALPSKREAFGLVNLEAMLTPLPIVASKVGGIPEIIKDGETGILVESENSHALAAAIKTLIADSGKRNEMANAGQKRALEHFDAKKMAEEYEQVYSKILS